MSWLNCLCAVSFPCLQPYGLVCRIIHLPSGLGWVFCLQCHCTCICKTDGQSLSCLTPWDCLACKQATKGRLTALFSASKPAIFGDPQFGCSNKVTAVFVYYGSSCLFPRISQTCFRTCTLLAVIVKIMYLQPSLTAFSWQASALVLGLPKCDLVWL